MRRTLDVLALWLMVSVSSGAVLYGLAGMSGCTSVYQGVVTLTSVVDGAAKAYASLYNQGLIPPDTSAKVAAAHLKYRQAAGIAQTALIAYKASGDPAQYTTALNTARQAATEFVSLILPFLYPDDSIALQTQLKKANAI